ncbi:hypothetical protein NBRC111893_1325 [Lentilactobacillus kosonis]|uniref:Uncharacterized protein n=1 Tax=Lentilactobacillus kosonis TaxID=2810561 RepID=A0A401FLB9_9LACO|nr:hypothetical protein NBRC111893_1325 [Lentilactobacillus kosonis]
MNRQSEGETIKQSAKKGFVSIRVSSSTEAPIEDIMPNEIFNIINPSSHNSDLE